MNATLCLFLLCAFIFICAFSYRVSHPVAGGPLPDMILQPFFKTIDKLSKNAGSKHGNIEAATKSIDSALIGMSGWIGKGNWKVCFGDIFLCFRDSMQRYYLRLTG